MNNDIETFLFLVPILFVSMTLHELAHAVVATRLGDPTPREQGRLSLNPIVHLDPMGTLMFVATYFLSNFLFGWAKPVSVNPRYFRRPKEGMAVVAFAGPATNFVIALVCLAVVVHLDVGHEGFKVIARSYELNLVLGIFNLIPIPPLDGSRIVGALLPDPMYVRWAQLDQYGMFAVFGLLFLFGGEFQTLLGSAYSHSTNLMLRIVGG